MPESSEPSQISAWAAARIKDQGRDPKGRGEPFDTVKHLRGMAGFVGVGVIRVGSHRNGDRVLSFAIPAMPHIVSLAR